MRLVGVARSGRWRLSLVVVPLLLVIAGGISRAADPITVCGSGCDHDTIQAAVDAAPDGATIQVEAGTYTEMLTISKAITVVGADPATTVLDAAGSGTAITVATGGELTLEGFTITGGSTSGHGGGILNQGTTSLSRVIVAGNEATSVASSTGGGIHSTGPLTVADSTISANSAQAGGGGVYVNGSAATVVIERTTLSGNQVTEGTTDFRGGGGLHVAGGATATVTETDIVDNLTEYTGGGATVRGSGSTATFDRVIFSGNKSFFGAGIRVQSSATATVSASTFNSNQAGHTGGAIRASAPTTITNSTFSGNSAPGGSGGAISSESTVDLDSVTITANTAKFGGGVSSFSSGDTTVANSILFGNAGSDLGADCAGTIHSAGATWVGDPIDCTIDGEAPVTGTDPLLGPLSDNGGFTATHALDPASPAVDAGATSLALDQRGEPRPSGTAPDVGAFEVQQDPPADDSDAPTWTDATLTAEEVRDDRVTLTWSEATDDVAVSDYEVEQGGVVVATVDGSQTSAQLGGLRPDTVYEFSVQAVDDAGNRSTDGPRIKARTAPGLPAGHLLPSPAAPDQSWQALVPTDGLEAARQANQIVVVASTGGGTPVTGFVDLATTANLDIDRDGTDDIEVDLTLRPGPGAIPLADLGVVRLTSPGPSDVQVLALVPLPDALATELGKSMLVVGFGTVGNDGSPGGTLPDEETIRLGTDVVGGLSHRIDLGFDTDGTPNPLEFYAGTAEGESPGGGAQAAGLVAMRVVRVPATIDTALTVDASALTAPDPAAHLNWTWNAPTDEGDPEVTFSYLESERPSRDDEADHHTEVTVQTMKETTTLDLVFSPDTEGLQMDFEHDNSSPSFDTIGEVVVDHRQRDSLEMTAKFQRVRDGLHLTALNEPAVVTLNGGSADLHLVLEVTRLNGDLLQGAFTNPVSWLFARIDATDGLELRTDGTDPSRIEMALPGREHGDIIVVAADDPADLRFPDHQTWPSRPPSAWSAGSEDSVQFGLYDGPDASTLALRSSEIEGMTVDLDPETLSQTIGLTAGRSTDLDAGAQLEPGQITQVATTLGCQAHLLSGVATLGVETPTNYTFTSGGGMDLGCHGARGGRSMSLTARRFPEIVNLGLDLASDASGGLTATVTDSTGLDEVIRDLELVLVDEDDGFTSPSLLGSPVEEVGFRADALPSSTVSWSVSEAAGTSIVAESLAPEDVFEEFGMYLATDSSVEAFQPEPPSERPSFGSSSLPFLRRNSEIVHLWEGETLTVLAAGIDAARSLTFHAARNGFHEVELELVEPDDTPERPIIVDLALPANGHFLDDMSITGWCSLTALPGVHTVEVELPRWFDITNTSGEEYPEGGCRQWVAVEGLDLEVEVDGAGLPSGTRIEADVPAGAAEFIAPGEADHLTLELRDRSGLGLIPSPFGSPMMSALLRAEDFADLTGSWEGGPDLIDVFLTASGDTAVGHAEVSTADQVAPLVPFPDVFDPAHHLVLRDEGDDGDAGLAARVVGLESAGVVWEPQAPEPLRLGVTVADPRPLEVEAFVDFDSVAAPMVSGQPAQVGLEAEVADMGLVSTFTSDLGRRFRMTGPGVEAEISAHVTVDDDPSDETGNPRDRNGVITVDLLAGKLPQVIGIDTLVVFEDNVDAALVELSGELGSLDLVVADPRDAGVFDTGSNRLHFHAEKVADGLGLAISNPSEGTDGVDRHLLIVGQASDRIGRLFLLSDDEKPVDRHFGTEYPRFMIDLRDLPERFDLEVKAGEDPGTTFADLVFSDTLPDSAGPGDRIGSVELMVERDSPDNLAEDPTAALALHDGSFTAITRSDYARDVDDDYWVTSVRQRLNQLDGSTVSLPTVQDSLPDAADGRGPASRTRALADHVVVDQSNGIAMAALRLSDLHAVRIRTDALSRSITLERPTGHDPGGVYLAVEQPKWVEYGAAPEKPRPPEDDEGAPTVEDDKQSFAYQDTPSPSYTLDVLDNDCSDRDEEGECNDTDVADASTLTIAKGPSYGDATVIDGKVVYRPYLITQVGWDQFVYQVCDDEGDCAYGVARVLIEEQYLGGSYAWLASQPDTVTVTVFGSETTSGDPQSWGEESYGVVTSSPVAGGDIYLGPRVQPPVTPLLEVTRAKLLGAPTDLRLHLKAVSSENSEKKKKSKIEKTFSEFHLKVDSDGGVDLVGVHQTSRNRLWFGARGEDVEVTLHPVGVFREFVSGDQDPGEYGECDRVFGIDTCIVLLGLELEAELEGDETGVGMDGFFSFAPLTATSPSARMDGAAAKEYLPLVTLAADSLTSVTGKAQLQLEPFCSLQCELPPLDLETSTSVQGTALRTELWDRGFSATWLFGGTIGDVAVKLPASYEPSRSPWLLFTNDGMFDPYRSGRHLP